LLLGVLVAVVAAVGRGLGAVLVDAVGEELLHERRACVGGMARGDALVGRGLRARLAAILAGWPGGGLAVLADAVRAGVGRLVRAVRGRALEVARLGGLGAAVDRPALRAASLEGLLCLRAALLETGRAAGGRRRRRRAARGALQVLGLGGLPACLERPASGLARLGRRPGGGRALLDAGRRAGGRRILRPGRHRAQREREQRGGEEIGRASCRGR